ncbi:AraC family transcriptional regulator [Dyadobacter jejuensis]|nr:helix-turn-helix domain-containing protein [Dyadobacter jejuensis]
MKEVIKTTRPHGHKDYLEMIFLTEGAGLHHIDLHTFTVTPNHLYFVLPGQIHSWELTEIPKGYVIMFQKDFLLETNLYEWLFQKFPQPLQNCYNLSPMLADFVSIFNQMEQEHLHEQAHYHEIIQALVILLFSKLRRLDSSSWGSITSNTIQQFFMLLSERYHEQKDVQTYADLLNITSRTLNNACKKYLNKTASEVISEKILQEAKKRLLYSDANLADIAFELNFTDPSHFNKFFKRQTGVLPGVYRKGIS